jgi:hypothetical protein
MPTLKTTVIPEPAPNTRAVIVSKVAPIMKGQGDLSYECGGCGTLLVDRFPGSIRGIVFKCPNCGAFSEV